MTDPNAWQCPHCGHTSAVPSMTRQHIREHHPDQHDGDNAPPHQIPATSKEHHQP